MKKLFLSLVFSFLILFLFTSGSMVYAEKSDELPTPDSYIESVLDELPSEVKEKFPVSDNYEDFVQTLDSGYLLSLSLSFFQKTLDTIYQYITFFLTALILGALAERIENTFIKQDLGVSSHIALLLIALEAVTIVYSLFQNVAEYCKTINGYMIAFTGVMASVSLLGGGAVFASTSSTSLSFIVTILGSLCTVLLFPIIKLSFAAALTSITSQRINLNSFSSFLRGFFTFLISFVSLISIVTITFQTKLAQAEDTLTARSLRFAASSSIPIVGNAVGDSVRTLGAAVSVIQKSVGTVGVVGLIIITLYPLSLLFSAKIAFSLSQTVAKLLDVTSAEKLLCEVSSLINMLLATVSILSVLYIFVTALFTNTAIPIL